MEKRRNNRGPKDGRLTYRKQDSSLPKAYVFDLDGTLAFMVNRSPYDHLRVGEDVSNAPVVETALRLQETGVQLVFVSGRVEASRPATEGWLEERGLNGPLFMRKDGDNRGDDVVKEEIYAANVEGTYFVVAVFDDRQRVVNHLRSLGYPVFQVAPGDF